MKKIYTLVLVICILIISIFGYRKKFSISYLEEEMLAVSYIKDSMSYLVMVESISDDKIIDAYNYLTIYKASAPLEFKSYILSTSKLLDYTICDNLISLTVSNNFKKSNLKLALAQLYDTYFEMGFEVVNVFIDGIDERIYEGLKLNLDEELLNIESLETLGDSIRVYLYLEEDIYTYYVLKDLNIDIDYILNFYKEKYEKNINYKIENDNIILIDDFPLLEYSLKKTFLNYNIY